MLVRWSHGIIASAALVLTLSMAGCSTQAKRVDCDGTLKPINRPAPAAASSRPPNEARSGKGNASDER
jgi:hypothetical protein